MKTLSVMLGFLIGLWFLSLMVGWFVQPWAPLWFGQQQAMTLTLPEPGVITDITNPPVISGNHVSDAERFQLISAAGAPPGVAVVMTALSIAEDGSGDPAVISKPNRNGTVDIGLWQDNSAHVGQCGITSIAWLQDPLNNARAAMCILGPHLNYCAWSTYETSCGPGHTGAYLTFLPCARAVASGAVCKR